jgi:HCOMODA/2-hydroxy-3-carboxy-muconic semialdehyde decarboxylase
MAVVHSHAEDVLPYGIVRTRLIPVIHSASVIGGEVPVWDIRAKFGDTNLLVRNMEQGRDLAQGMGQGRAVLMRGHGFAAGGISLTDVVRIAVYMPRNARVQQAALRLAGEDGEIIPLSPGELKARFEVMTPHSAEMWRAWEYWATRAGCADMLGEKPQPAKK